MHSLPPRKQLGMWALSVCIFFGASAARSQSLVSVNQSELPSPQCDAGDRFVAQLSELILPSPRDYCYMGRLFLKNTSFNVALDVCSFKIPERAHCLLPLLKKLGTMPDRCEAGRLDEFRQRQKITELITTASLEVEGFLAEVDNESNHIREVKDTLTNRQTTALTASSKWNNVGTTGGAVGSALSIAARTATAGSWVGAVFGGVGAIFGWKAYVQGLKSPIGCFPSPTRDGRLTRDSCEHFVYTDCPEKETAKPGCSPTMLYHLLEKNPDPQKENEFFHSRYDSPVGSYVTERKQELLDAWDQVQAGNPKVTVKKMTSSPLSPAPLSVDEMTNRQSMLANLRALAARMSRDLSRLSNDVNTGLPECQADYGN